MVAYMTSWNSSIFISLIKVFSCAVLVSACASSGGRYDRDKNENFNVIKQSEGFIRYEHFNDKETRLMIEDHAIAHCTLINKTASRGKTDCLSEVCTTTYLCQSINLLNRD